MEFGYWQGREQQKMIYGRPDDAYRIGYLDVMWKAVAKEKAGYSPLIYNSMETTIAASIEKANDRFNKSQIIKDLIENK